MILAIIWWDRSKTYVCMILHIRMIFKVCIILIIFHRADPKVFARITPTVSYTSNYIKCSIAVNCKKINPASKTNLNQSINQFNFLYNNTLQYLINNLWFDRMLVVTCTSASCESWISVRCCIVSRWSRFVLLWPLCGMNFAHKLIDYSSLIW